MQPNQSKPVRKYHSLFFRTTEDRHRRQGQESLELVEAALNVNNRERARAASRLQRLDKQQKDIAAEVDEAVTLHMQLTEEQRRLCAAADRFRSAALGSARKREVKGQRKAGHRK